MSVDERISTAGAALFLLTAFGGALGAAVLAPEGPRMRAAEARAADPAGDKAVAKAKALLKDGDWAGAAALLTPVAERGHPGALYQLGRLAKSGRGAPRDLERARLLLTGATRVASDIRGAAAHELAQVYRLAAGPDCDRIAFEWSERALGWGFEKAHLSLAKHYETGRGVAQDAGEALAHYRAAMRLGYESATLKFASLLARGGGGLEADGRRAAALGTAAIAALEQKALNGKASAAKRLARAYRDGQFVPQNDALAVKWFRRASHLGDAGAMHDLGLFLLARGADRSTVETALGWLTRATRLGHGGAMTALGRLHLSEQHGLARAGAVAWFERGVAAKHGGAMAELARLKATGDLLSKDVPGALALARQGAALGHRGAQKLLQRLAQRAGSNG